MPQGITFDFAVLPIVVAVDLLSPQPGRSKTRLSTNSLSFGLEEQGGFKGREKNWTEDQQIVQSCKSLTFARKRRNLLILWAGLLRGRRKSHVGWY